MAAPAVRFPVPAVLPDQPWADWYYDDYLPYMLWIKDLRAARRRRVWRLLRRVLRLSEAGIVRLLYYLDGLPL
jgi:hypothetical protein